MFKVLAEFFVAGIKTQKGEGGDEYCLAIYIYI
jgi:hypothetical protein